MENQNMIKKDNSKVAQHFYSSLFNDDSLTCCAVTERIFGTVMGDSSLILKGLR
jgi:hypothetical protein